MSAYTQNTTQNFSQPSLLARKPSSHSKKKHYFDSADHAMSGISLSPHPDLLRSNSLNQNDKNHHSSVGC